MNTEFNRNFYFQFFKSALISFSVWALHLCCLVSIRSPSSAKSLNNVDESSVVLHSALSSAGLLLFLLLFLHFGCLSLHFTGSGQRSVHFTASEAQTYVNIVSILELRGVNALVFVKRSTTTIEDLIFIWDVFGAFDKKLIKDNNRNKRQLALKIRAQVRQMSLPSTQRYRRFVTLHSNECFAIANRDAFWLKNGLTLKTTEDKRQTLDLTHCLAEHEMLVD